MTLTIASTGVPAGVPIPSTLVIVNKTGHTVRIFGCAVDQTFSVTLENAKASSRGMDGLVGCSVLLHPGANFVKSNIPTTYQTCGGLGYPKCSPPGMPTLPPGRYHTYITWPLAPPTFPHPDHLWVTLTAPIELSHFAPFPRAAQTGLGVTLTRPTAGQVAAAQVSVAQAYAVGLTQVGGTLPRGARVTVRLGLFADTVTSPFEARVLAYAVIFDGVDVPSLGPTKGPAGHELIVIVNARTGRRIESFSYR